MFFVCSPVGAKLGYEVLSLLLLCFMLDFVAASAGTWDVSSGVTRNRGQLTWSALSHQNLLRNKCKGALPSCHILAIHCVISLHKPKTSFAVGCWVEEVRGKISRTRRRTWSCLELGARVQRLLKKFTQATKLFCHQQRRGIEPR